VKTPEGNVAFRKGVMSQAMTDYGITLGAASSHYNHAFIQARKASAQDTALAALLEGLGRPEDKKGGRKKKVVVPPQQPEQQDAGAVSEVLESNVLAITFQPKVEELEAPAAEVQEQPAIEAPKQDTKSEMKRKGNRNTKKAAEQQPAA
jgi:hypothetical protein